MIGTDRERHQTSAVLIFQFVGKQMNFILKYPIRIFIALMFTITEIFLHINFYQKRCITKATEPSRESLYQCQILLIQTGCAAFVLLNTLIFGIIYIRLTILVLKLPHGTFNISNAINLTTC